MGSFVGLGMWDFIVNGEEGIINVVSWRVIEV